MKYRMRKKVLSIIAFILFFSLTNSTVFAQKRSKAKAQSIAEKKLIEGKPMLVLENEAFSIYRNNNREGFVIVSADEKLPEVLGYSDSGNFDPENLPTNMKFWMENTKRACDAVVAGKLSAQEAFATVEEGQKIEPLLGEIRWSQEAPYNGKCPTIAGDRCVTGCGATALAMLLKYYEYPTTGHGQVSYTSSNKIKISYDFEKAVFRYKKMLDSYSAPNTKDSKQTINKDLSSELACAKLAARGSYNGITVYADTLLCIKSGSFSGDIQFLLYSSDGEYLENVGSKVELDDLPYNSYYPHYPLVASMPNKYADGTYRLYLGSKASGSNEWALVKGFNTRSKRVTSPKYIEITKQGKNVIIGSYSGPAQYDPEDADAVAELMFACGAALEMDYGVKESSAGIISPFSKVIQYFGYDQDTYFGISDYMSNELMNKYIIEQIENHEPIYICGISEDGAGHAFIADGVRYSSTGNPLFHINWGWNGISNGYFLISNFSPDNAGTGGSQTNYSNTLYLILNLKPEDGKAEGPSLSYSELTCDKTEINAGEQIQISVSSLTNVSTYAFSGEFAVFFVNENGDEIKVGTLGSIKGMRTNSYTDIRNKSITVPASVPSGKYTIKVRGCSSTDTSLFGRSLGSKYPTITVSGTTDIIDTLEDNANDEDTVYDLYGRRVSKMHREGLYIKGNKLIIR